MEINHHVLDSTPSVGFSSGALHGLRVIDLSRVLAGPLCAQYLGDHGADVIKVEPPVGDETRSWGPFSENGSSYFSGLNRNKKNLALNLSQPEGQAILLRLLEGADVLIHNFKPGTFERWGLGYDEVLAKRFPRLIYCHITGFGETGPLGGLPGYDSVVQAMTGCMSVNGYPDGTATRVGMPIVDVSAGLNAVIAIVMAAFEREKSGLGQKLDIALFDCALPLLHPHAAGSLQAGVAPQRAGNEHPNIAPYELFQTSSGDIFLGVGNDGQFGIACRLLGCEHLLADPRFQSNSLRVENRVALHELLQEILDGHQAHEITAKLLRAGVPVGAVLDVPTVLSDAHVEHREMVVRQGGYSAVGIPIKFSRTPGSVQSVPERLGARSIEICRSLGMDDDEVDDLIRRSIVISDIPHPRSA